MFPRLVSSTACVPFSGAVTSGWPGLRAGRRGSEGPAAEIFSVSANPSSRTMTAPPTITRVGGALFLNDADGHFDPLFRKIIGLPWSIDNLVHDFHAPNDFPKSSVLPIKEIRILYHDKEL